MIIAHLPRHLIPESGSGFSGGRKKSGLPFQQTRFGDSESRRVDGEDYGKHGEYDYYADCALLVAVFHGYFFFQSSWVSVRR